MGCATHMAPTPSCPFRSCPEHVSCPTLKKSLWQKSLRRVGRWVQRGRVEEVLQESWHLSGNLNGQGLCGIMSHGRVPTLPTPTPIISMVRREIPHSFPASSEKMRTGRQNSHEVEICAAFHKLSVVEKEYSGRGACECQRTALWSPCSSSAFMQAWRITLRSPLTTEPFLSFLFCFVFLRSYYGSLGCANLQLSM